MLRECSLAVDSLLIETLSNHTFLLHLYDLYIINIIKHNRMMNQSQTMSQRFMQLICILGAVNLCLATEGNGRSAYR